MRHLLVAALGVLLAGCTYTLHVTSRPTGAVMTWQDGSTVVLPATVEFPWRPFAPPRVEVSAPGHRPFEIKVTRRVIRELDYVFDPVRNPNEAFGDQPRRSLEVLLVPEHGPAGTWGRHDVPGEPPREAPEGDGSTPEGR